MTYANNPKLIKITEFQKQFFAENSAPCRNTIKNWLRKGELNGSKRGKIYYIRLDEKVDKFISNDTCNPVDIDLVEEEPSLVNYPPAVLNIIQNKMKRANR